MDACVRSISARCLSVLATVLVVCVQAAFCAPAKLPTHVLREADGVVVPWEGKFLKIQVCAEDIIRVACAPDPAFFKRSSLAVVPQGKVKHWDFELAGDTA